MNVNMGCDKYTLTLLIPFRSTLYLLMFTPLLKKKNCILWFLTQKTYFFFQRVCLKLNVTDLYMFHCRPPPQRLMKFSDIAFWLIALLSCPSLLDKSEYSFYEGNGPVRSPITPVPIVNNLQVI